MRPKNEDLRERERLRPEEVERVIEAVGDNRHGLDGTADNWQLMPASAKRLAHWGKSKSGLSDRKKTARFSRPSDNMFLVSVRDHIESDESFVIQG
jgi:hypothetical protein